MYSVKVKILCMCLLTGLSCLPVRAQDSATDGTDFYVTFTNNADKAANVCQVRYVVTETCYITAQYGDGSYLGNNVQYAPGVYTLSVDKSKCYYVSKVTGAYNLMLHVTSTRNIGVFALNMDSGSSDATTVLPVSIWGTDYTAISGSSFAIGPNYITVIAPTDGTTFNIYNAAGTLVATHTSTTANPVYSYTLSADITGYTVESDQKIAVYSSVPCGNGVYGGCDHNYEQLYPTSMAGRSYFAWNISTTMVSAYATEKVIFMALEDGTTVTQKAGATVTTIPLDRHDKATYTFSSAAIPPVMLTSDKPIIVNHILGVGPSVKWWIPVEQRITRAVIAPFVAVGTSYIVRHRLSVMIPDGSQSDMIVRETRNGVVTTPTLSFSSNTSNPYYLLANRDYEDTDDVMIELINPAGFIAYMAGGGYAEGYIYTAGSGAFDLQNYFTITTKTQPYNDTHYTATDEATHTFAPSDNITVKRTLERTFTNVSWRINGTTYTGVTENTNTSNTLTLPASAFPYGKDSITLAVRYSGATADSLYTGYVTVTTEANFASIAPVNVTRGGNHTYTVKLPNGVTADRNIVVNLSYSGATTAFNAGPPSVTIPNGSNSANFNITSTTSAPYGSTMNITLSGTNYAPVVIGSDDEAIIRVGASTPSGTDFWFVAPHMSDDTDATLRYYPAFLAISNNTYQTAHSVITIYNGGSLITLRDTIAPGGFIKRDF
ncbi:MAG: hypothetical protein LBJ58_02895, partial [Tannerellaceae bacterium]|nr:hypothetical protein [Tannerellaceae bacterium]